MSNESNAIATVPTDAQITALLVPTSSDSAPPSTQYRSIPYVGFRGQKSFKHKEALDAAGVQVNDFYLNDVQPIAIKPFELHILHYGRLYTITDDEGKISDAIFTRPTDGEYAEGFNDHVLAAVAVVQSTDSGPLFTAATLSLRGAQSKALKLGLELIEGRASDAAKWSSVSPGHAGTAHAAVPGGRFKLAIWNTQELPKNGGTQKYNMGNGRIVMPKKADVDAFNAWIKREFASVASAINVNNARLKKARELASTRTGEPARAAAEAIPF